MSCLLLTAAINVSFAGEGSIQKPTIESKIKKKEVKVSQTEITPEKISPGLFKEVTALLKIQNSITSIYPSPAIVQKISKSFDVSSRSAIEKFKNIYARVDEQLPVITDVSSVRIYKNIPALKPYTSCTRKIYGPSGWYGIGFASCQEAENAVASWVASKTSVILESVDTFMWGSTPDWEDWGYEIHYTTSGACYKN
jgi:hypothetical protein